MRVCGTDQRPNVGFSLVKAGVAQGAFVDDARNEAAASVPATFALPSDSKSPSMTIKAYGVEIAISTALVDGNAGSACKLLAVCSSVLPPDCHARVCMRSLAVLDL